MFWILFGVLAFLFVRNRFDLQGVIRDVRKIGKAVRRTIRELARTIRHAVRDAKKETEEERKNRPVQAAIVPEAPAVQEETVLPAEPEQTAMMAAMLANVPTISFPKDDPKYDSSRKYRYA